MTLVYKELILMMILSVAIAVCSYLARVLRQKKYAHHVTFNPLTKSEERFLKHPYGYALYLIALIAFCCWFFVNYTEGNLQQFYFGMFISLLSMALGYMIGVSLVFLYSFRNPEKISGQVVFEDRGLHALHIQAPFMACVILFVSLAVIHPTPFIYGGLVAAIGMLLLLFISMSKRQKAI